MDFIYTAISWILLRWHDLWDKVLPDGRVLGTNWDWILSIVFLVITIRVILFPVFVKQIKSQRAMQALQPQVKELQAKHKGDRETMQKELMELYKKEKANPLMGCLPMFLQIPVFLGLFHVLRRLRPDNGAKTLYGWTAEQFDSAAAATLFKAPIAAHFTSSAEELAKLGASGVTVKIVAGVLVAIMIVTTYLTSRQMILKTGWSEDPQQKMIQRLMLYGIPFSLLISGGLFPIGVVIYWVTTNLFSLGQQFWVLRKYPPPPMARTARRRRVPTAPSRTCPRGRRPTTPGRRPRAATSRRVRVPSRSRARRAGRRAGRRRVDATAVRPVRLRRPWWAAWRSPAGLAAVRRTSGIFGCPEQCGVTRE
jgi:YidC/Oxa1 family membrane protein insertase